MNEIRSEIDGMRARQQLPPLAEHQIILVGANPLPCYVAAQALQPKRITLVTSEDLATRTEILKQQLVSEGFVCDEPLVTIRDPSSSRAITRAIGAIRGIETSGLHYTGGKKTMAVHAHTAWLGTDRQRTQASYVDSQSAELVFDDTDVRIPLRVAPQVVFGSLLAMHGIGTHANACQTAAQWESLAVALAKDIAALTVEGFREVWPPRDTGGRPMSADEVAATPPAHDLSALQAVKAYFDGVFGPRSESDSYDLSDFIIDFCSIPAQGRLAAVPGKPKRTKAVKWLDGTWLDEFTWATLVAIQPQSGLHDSVFNIKGTTRGGNQFELDAACMRGHTFFAFSCTTGERELTKLKLFEARVRAQQLGGDHARYAVVSLLKEGVVAALEQELQEAWDAAPIYFKVFGRAEVLGTFATSVRDWINKVHGA
jgi:hypothetical protein